MIDDLTLNTSRSPGMELPANAHRNAPTGARAQRRPPLRFPPRLEISPLTIRPACGGHDGRLMVC
jgi:hypothetical protein